MNALVLTSNRRKDGFTAHYLDLFLEGLALGGARTRVVDVPSLDVKPCLQCYACWLATPGRCVHKDDMEPLLAEWVASDAVVLVTPVLHYTLASDLKRLIERTFPLHRPGLDLSDRGLERNRRRHPDARCRSMVLVAVGALRSSDNFTPLVDTTRLIAESLDMELVGTLLRPESHLLQYTASKPRTLRTIRTAWVEAGRQLAALGRISPETEARAALRYATDLPAMMDYASVYWEHAENAGPRGIHPATLEDSVGRDDRILVREMVRRLDPTATARARFTLVLDFPDLPRAWTLRVDRGRCDLEEGAGEGADLVLRTASTTWADVIQGKVDPRHALRDGRISLEGDRSIFLKLGRTFDMERE